MRQLSSADWTMVSLDSPTAHNTIGIVGIYDSSTRPGGGELTYDEVLRYVGARLHIADSFRERIVHVPFGLDRPWWVRDDTFDLEYHIREIALPKPGTWRQLCTQIARIHARPLDLRRPPWELYVIDGLDAVDHLPDDAFAVFLRVHHAAIDGVAGAEILTAIHTNEPDSPPPPPPDEPWESEPVPGDVELLARAAANGAVRPVNVLRVARRVAGQLPGLRSDMRNPDVTSPASLPKATRFNRTVGPHRVFGTSYTTLDTLKEIRKAVPGAKINDVGLAVVGGAIRAYLLGKGELPDEPLLAMMPISVRPTITQRGGAADGPVQGNEYSIAPITMATDEADPLVRLQRIVASTAHVKESGAHPVRTLIEMSEEAFGGLMGTVQRAAVRALSRTGRTVAGHTLVSNVPGPLTPMYFCGARMIDTSGLGPVLDGMALNNGIGSYGNRVTFCFTADRDALPDPEVYEQCLSGAVDELLDAARARASAQVVRSGPMAQGATFYITGDPVADQLLHDEPMALLLGMLFDQQVPMEWAFASPAKLHDRLGHLDATKIAEMDPDAFLAVCTEKPAIHRFPGSMGKRAFELCTVVAEQYDGDAANVWTGAATGQELLDRLEALPGFGKEKARIFLAVLAKRLGVRPPGWDEAAAPFSDDVRRSVADADSPEHLQEVRAFKKAMKAKGKGKAD